MTNTNEVTTVYVGDLALRVQSMARPWVPVGHPEFKWTSGADVQATWRKYGWTPPSERLTPPPPEKVVDKAPEWLAMRRVK